MPGVFQASGVMQDGTVHNSEASLRPSDPHRMSRPMPVRVRGDGVSTPLSLLHKVGRHSSHCEFQLAAML